MDFAPEPARRAWPIAKAINRAVADHLGTADSLLRRRRGLERGQRSLRLVKSPRCGSCLSDYPIDSLAERGNYEVDAGLCERVATLAFGPVHGP